MPNLLDLVYVALLLACTPILMWKGWRNGKYRDGWSEKFLGTSPRRISDRPCVWFHAVSVGEVLLLRPLVAELARPPPELGRGDLVHDHHRAGRGAADLSRTSSRSTPRWTSPGPPAAPWPGSGPRCWPWSSWSLWPNLIASAKRSGAGVAVINGQAVREELPGLSADQVDPERRTLASGSTRSRPRARTTPGRFVALGVPRPHVSVTGFGQVRRPGERTGATPPRTSRLKPRPGPVPLRDRVRGRQHDGRGGRGGFGRLPPGAGPSIPGSASCWSPATPRGSRSVAADPGSSRGMAVRCVAADRCATSRGTRRSGPDRHPGGVVGGLGPGRRGVRGREPPARAGAART